MNSLRVLPLLASAAVLITSCGGDSGPSILDGEATCALLTESDFDGVEGTVSSVSSGEGRCMWSDDRGELINVFIERLDQDLYESLTEVAAARTGEPDIDGIDATLVTEASAAGYAGGVSLNAFVLLPASLQRDTLIELLERWASA